MLLVFFFSSLDSYWRGNILVILLAKISFSTAFLLLNLSSWSILSNYILPKGKEKSVTFELGQFPSSHFGLNFSLCTLQTPLVLLLLLTHVSVALESHSESALIISKACGSFVTFRIFLSLLSCFFLASYLSENYLGLPSSWWKVSCVGKHH